MREQDTSEEILGNTLADSISISAISPLGVQPLKTTREESR
jgi:hypothetical protein